MGSGMERERLWSFLNLKKNSLYIKQVKELFHLQVRAKVVFFFQILKKKCLLLVFKFDTIYVDKCRDKYFLTPDETTVCQKASGQVKD